MSLVRAVRVKAGNLPGPYMGNEYINTVLSRNSICAIKLRNARPQWSMPVVTLFFVPPFGCNPCLEQYEKLVSHHGKKRVHPFVQPGNVDLSFLNVTTWSSIGGGGGGGVLKIN